MPSILLFKITLHTEKNYSTCLYLINSVESAFFYALKYISDILYPALDRVTNITKTICMAVDCCTTLNIVRHLSHNCITYGTGTRTSGRKIRARSQVWHKKYRTLRTLGIPCRDTLIKNLYTPCDYNIVIYCVSWLPKSTLIVRVKVNEIHFHCCTKFRIQQKKFEQDQWRTQEFCSGGFNKFSWGQGKRGSRGGSSLVRGSESSCKLVQEISFRIVKFS